MQDSVDNKKIKKISIFKAISLCIICLLILSLIAVMGISLYTASQLIHPAKKAFTYSLESVPNHEEVIFKDINNKINLKGWYFKSNNSDKSIIFCHGYKKNKLNYKDKTFDMAKSFLDKGYNFFIFDFRNCGESDGDLTTIGYFEKDDLNGAINFVKSKGSKHIILLGVSMGASTSVLVASDRNDIDALILDSPFADLSSYLDENLPYWSKLPRFPFNNTILMSFNLLTGINMNAVSPINRIIAFKPKPILFIHSMNDKAIPVKNSLQLYEVYSKITSTNVEIWTTFDARHSEAYLKYPIEYMHHIFKFLDKIYKT